MEVECLPICFKLHKEQMRSFEVFYCINRIGKFQLTECFLGDKYIPSNIVKMIYDSVRISLYVTVCVYSA